MLNHSSVEHSCGDIPPSSFLLQGIETLEDDSFPDGKTVFHIWEIVTGVTSTHMEFSLVGQSAQESSIMFATVPKTPLQARRGQGHIATSPSSSTGLLLIPVLLC